MMIDQSDLQGGCLLPLAQSAVSGVIGGLVAFSLALMADQVIQRAGLLALVGGAVAAGACWLWRLRYWHHSLELDSAYQYNLLSGADPDDHTGPAPLVRVELGETEGATRRQKMIDLPARPEQLQSLARGLVAGAAFSQAAWTGSGAEFTRAEFAALQGELIKRGLARWNNPATPARGVALTPAGRAVMKHIAEVAHD